MKKFKLYLETSVWCHYYADDAPEKVLITKALFELIEKGMYEIYTSELVVTEIKKAQEIDKIKLGIFAQPLEKAGRIFKYITSPLFTSV